MKFISTYLINKIVSSFFILSILFIAQNGYSQSPGNVSVGLRVWLKANAGTTNAGANLTSWADQSPFVTPIAVNGSPDLIPIGYNFNPYINFTYSVPSGGDFLHTPMLFHERASR